MGAVAVFSNMFFQSLGKSWRATILAVCRQGLCIPLVFLLSHLFGLSGLVATQATCDLLSFLISSTIFLQYFRGEYAAECARSQSHS